MQSRREIIGSSDDHDEPIQMVPRLCERIPDTPHIRRRGHGNRFGVRMPVADEVESFMVHGIDLVLFLAAVRNIEMSKTEIRRPRPGGSFEHDVAFDELREQLPACFERMGIALLMPRKMIQDGGADDQALA